MSRLTTKKTLGRIMALLLLLTPWSGAATAEDQRWGDPNRGAAIYEDYCQECHDPASGQMDPNIPDFSLGEGLDRSDEDLIRFLKQGEGLQPGFQHILSDGDLLDVIAYLRTL